MPKQPEFRWEPQEEIWLMERVFEDGGQSKNNRTFESWRKSLVAKFKTEFPPVARRKPDGRLETDIELMSRWQDIPRRVKRWLGNHQSKIVGMNDLQRREALCKLATPKRQKRTRAKNARDMAKTHDPLCKQKWQTLYSQFKAGTITKTEMFYEHNKFVNELLQDPDLLQKYSDMAKENSVETRIQVVEESNQAGAAPPQEFVFVFNPSVQVQDGAPPNAPSPTLNISDSLLSTSQAPPQTISASPLDTQPQVELLHFDFDSAWNDFLSQDPLPQARIVPETDSNDMDSSFVRTPVSYLRDTQIPQHEVAPAPFVVNPTSSSLPRPQTEMSSTEGLMQPSHTTVQTSEASHHYGPYAQPSNNSSLTLTRTTPPSHLQAGSLRTTSTAPKLGSIEGTWYLHRVYRGNNTNVYSVALSRNARFIAFAAYSGEVIFWDVESDGVVARSRSVRGYSGCIACSNDGRRVALSRYLGTQIVIWDVEKTSLILNEHIGLIREIAFSPDDSRIVSRDSDSTIFVWDSSSGQVICKLQNPTCSPFNHLHFSDDGKLVVALHHKIHAWDAESGESTTSPGDLACMPLPPRRISSWTWVTFEDGSLHKWHTSERITAISHDSRYLASGYGNKIILYSQEPPPPGEGPVQVDDIPEDRRIITFEKYENSLYQSLV